MGPSHPRPEPRPRRAVANRMQILAVAGVLAAAGGAGAEDYRWVNPTSGAWNAAANWQPYGVPATAADSAYVPAGPALVIDLDLDPYLRGCLLANPAASLRLDGRVLGADRLRNRMTIVANQGFASGLNGGVLNETGGEIRIEGGAQLSMYGASWRNDGMIILPTGSAQAAYLRPVAHVEFAGAGSLVMQDTTFANLDSPAGWVLTNGPGHTIRGAGGLSAPLVNHGRVDADRAGEWLRLFAQGKTNDGIMAATGGGRLRIDGVTLTNTGGTVLADGGTVRLENATVAGGALAGAAGGEIVVLGGTVLWDAHLAGDLRVAPGAVLALAGSSFANDGTVHVQPGGGAAAYLRLAGNVTASGGGRIMLEDAALAVLDSPAGWVLTNAEGHAVTGAGIVSAPLVNRGVVKADRPGADLLLNYQNKTNEGLLQAIAGGRLRISGVTLTNTGGEVRADGGDVHLENTTVAGGDVVSAAGHEIVVEGGVTLWDPHLAGDVRVAPSAVLALAGTSFANDGTVHVRPDAGAAAYLRVAGHVTASGGGRIMLEDAALAVLDSPAGWVLTNAEGHAVTGAGIISAPLVNHGVLAADRAGEELLLCYQGKANDGLVRAVAGGQLRIAGVALNNVGGELRAEGGPVCVENCTITGGDVASGGGAVVTVRGTAAVDGIRNTGRIEVAELALLGLAGNPLTNDGAIFVHTGGAGAAYLRLVGHVTVVGGGAIELNQATLAILDSPAGWALTNGAGHRIHGAGIISAPLLNQGEVCGDRDGAALVLSYQSKVNEGTFAARAGGRLILEILPANYDPGTRRLTGGAWEAADGGVIELRNCPVDTIAGDVVLDGPGARITRDAEGHDALAGLARIAPAGSLTLRNGVAFATAGGVVNGGRLVLGCGCAFTAGGGGLTQTGTGVYRVEIASGGPVGGGILAVPGLAQLAGGLEVALVGGFRPAYGDTFEILTFGARDGAFAADGPLVADGMILAQVWRPHALVLRVIGETAVGDQPADVLPSHTSFVARGAPGGATALALALPAPARIEVAVYDLRGTRVATVARGEEAAGVHEYAWTGNADTGGRLASGVYLARAMITVAGRVEALTTKVTVVR